MNYREYYEQIRRDSPQMDELHVQINALTAARLEAQLAKRRQQLGGVRLVPAQTASPFVTSLLSNVDTRGRLPVVRADE